MAEKEIHHGDLRLGDVEAAEEGEKKSQEAAEKRRVLHQLKEYRKVHGLGCFEFLAKKYGREGDYFSADMARWMCYSLGRFRIETWRAVGQALDQEERSGVDNG